MSELRFDGRVASGTGGGRGLGRSYALLLASRGAKVVVNDLGVTRFGEEPDSSPAQDVVNEIKAFGCEAVANTGSVSSAEGGKAIVQSALDNFGRIDIIIANAGFNRPGPFRDLALDDFEAILGVHLMGSYHIAQAAYPLMLDQNYGRLVLTSSIAGIYSEKMLTAYAVAKASLIGLSQVLAHEGAANNVLCNAIVPSAETRLAEGRDTSMFPDMRAELVALAGRMALAYVTETKRIYQADWTIEQVAARWGEISDSTGGMVFLPVPSGFNDHLGYSFAMAKAGGAKTKAELAG